jgi:hypothetical protein
MMIVNHTFQPALLALPAPGQSREVALSKRFHGLERLFHDVEQIKRGGFLT